MRDKAVYVADFETHNSNENIENSVTGVWLWDICSIDDLNHITGLNLNDFMYTLELLAPCVMYTHNLKFDGSFIIDYLFKNGYNHSENKILESREFSTLITDTGVFYSIKVCLNTGNKKVKKIVEFRDSSKKISGTVEHIAKSYALPILKGTIDYKLNRDENYTPSENEIAYVKNDTEIIARVLQLQYDKGLINLTTSSDTFKLFKTFCGKYFKMLFPVVSVELDDFLRDSYRGGVCQVNEKFKGKWLTSDCVYDVNSMYPAQMCDKLLPYGQPQYYKGKYIKDKKHPLFIQKILVCCSVKPNFRPTVLLNNSKWHNSNYLIDTGLEMIELTLTNVDLDLLFKHYDIYDIKYIEGYKFLGSLKLFKAFIEPIYERKCNSKGAEKELYKLLLNALYGKFASNPKHTQKIPYMLDGVVKFKLGETEYAEPIYTAVSSFITAYSRQLLFNTIQDNIDSFIYCDTDSVHLCEPIKGAKIDSKALGAWKYETEFNMVVKACYLAQKTYMQVFEDGSREIKLAGCPSNVKAFIKESNFKFNSSFKGKLLPKRVNGGVILKETEFTIKPR